MLWAIIVGFITWTIIHKDIKEGAEKVIDDTVRKEIEGLRKLLEELRSEPKASQLEDTYYENLEKVSRVEGSLASIENKLEKVISNVKNEIDDLRSSIKEANDKYSNEIKRIVYGAQESKKVQGITKVLTFDLFIASVLGYYLRGMSLFSKEEADLIESRWQEKKIEEETNNPDEITTNRIINLSVIIETRSTGFKKILVTHTLSRANGNSKIIKSQAHSFKQTQGHDHRWYPWTFDLREFLKEEEYLRIVGKEPESRSTTKVSGEKLTMWLNSEQESLIVFGQNGRFKEFVDNPFMQAIPDENIILRILPGVKEYRSENVAYTFETGHSSAGDENYQEWKNKGNQIFWSIALFDAYGIKEQENRIIEPVSVE